MTDETTLQLLLTKVPLYVTYASQLLGVLCIASTVIVRLTPSKTDDEKVGKAVRRVWAVLAWLPTLGLNPKTKEMKETYDNIMGVKKK